VLDREQADANHQERGEETMNLDEINWYHVFDLFLLLLIGMGPKIALVPFLEMTKEMDGETQKKVANRMLRTAW
jgi:multiple antibiotic resistance protein